MHTTTHKGARRTALARVKWLFARLNESRIPLSAAALASEYECSAKVIYRDVDLLRDAFGLPIKATFGGGGLRGGFYFERGASVCCPFCAARSVNNTPLVILKGD